jgi:hypothetical protein
MVGVILTKVLHKHHGNVTMKTPVQLIYANIQVFFKPQGLDRLSKLV